MDVGAKTGLADAHQQLAERGIARQTGAQGQSIDEAADHCFQRRLAAVRNGCADGDVVESCVAGEKDLECRQQYHEQRGAVVHGQLPQGAGQFR